MSAKNKRIRKNKRRKPPLRDRFGFKLPNLPAVPSGVILRSSLITAFVMLLSIALIFIHDFLTQWDYLNVHDIRIEGLHRLSRRDVMAQAMISRHDNILAINLSAAQTRLASHPWIAAVELQRELPATLIIRIREHEPLALIDVGRQLLINTEGHVFKEKTPDDPENLPVITGMDYSDLVRENADTDPTYKAALDLLALVNPIDNKRDGMDVIEVAVDPELGLTLHAAGQVRSIFIGYTDYPEKCRRIKRLLAFLEKTGQFPQIETIDVSNADRIVVKPAVVVSSAGAKKGGVSCKDRT